MIREIKMALKNVFNKKNAKNAFGVTATAAGLALTGAAIAGGAFLTIPLTVGLASYIGYGTVKNWKKPTL